MKKILILCILLLFNNIHSQSVTLESFGPSFDSPVEIKHAGDDRLFIVEQPGEIKILNSNGTVNSTPFLDIKDKVYYGGERGLLGLAFHPNYPSTPYFFVNYTNNSSDTVIAKYSVSSNADIANTNETILLTIDQPYSNHNGGCINFGPDGYLYIGMGDGGSGGDPQNYSQNLNSFLGKMLRIDVDNGSPYAVPNDNPYGDEIWASGLRNPWKFSFDTNGDFWIADVGQYTWEEINLVTNDPGGLNYGWRCYEGNHTFNTSSNCPDASTLTFPVGEYSHNNSGFYKCSITGGFVYRGSQISGMNGVYFFADYCSQEIGMLSYNSSSDSWDMYLDSPNATGSWVTFGEDINQELYVASVYGSIYKITDAALSLNSVDHNKLNFYPNPTEGIILFNNYSEPFDLIIYDINGRIVIEHNNYSSQELNISKLNAGIYFMRINNTYTQKIIKK